MKLDPSIIPSLTTGTLSIAGVILAAWLAARFTAGRFYTERTWDRKANAYTTVFDGLHSMQTWSDENLSALYEGRELSAEKDEKLRREYQAAKERIRREIATATWLLKPEVEEAISGLWRVLNAHYETWHDDLDATYGAIARTQTKLRDIAREDLGLRKPRRKWPWQRSAETTGTKS